MPVKRTRKVSKKTSKKHVKRHSKKMHGGVNYVYMVTYPSKTTTGERDSYVANAVQTDFIRKQ